MITHFSLYGFLKNLRFFEPFFLLFLRQNGLSFLEIGLLFSFREICINIMEVPSGVLADLYGRKSAMQISLSSYILSFIIFGLELSIPFVFLAMFLFAIGEAFRTGTHKAMIFDYLRYNNRVNEKTKVYGYTRSWSQLGSALSVLLGSFLVFYTGNYKYIFWLSILPYILGLINISMYPNYLNRRIEFKLKIKKIFMHLYSSSKTIIKIPKLRHLFIQSIFLNGQFKSIKDYLQVLIKAQVIAVPVFLTLNQEKRVAVLIGIVYFILYFLSSIASKNSFRLIPIFGSKEKATTGIILLTLILIIIAGIGTYLEQYAIPILCFIFLFNLQNMWQPILISQFDDYVDSDKQATILSIESQAQSLGIFLIAPIVGYGADNYGLYAVFAVSALFLGLYIIILSYVSFKNRANLI